MQGNTIISKDGAPMAEVGRVGTTRQYNGRRYDRLYPHLSGLRAVETYKDMADNNAVIRAGLFAVESLIRRVEWRTEPASQSPVDLRAEKFLRECMNDQSETWNDIISNNLSMLRFGYADHEILYKIRRGPDQQDGKFRSKYSDGLVGWRKMPIRRQESIDRFVFDETNDSFRGIEQRVEGESKLRFIPIQKMLHFQTHPMRGEPEGDSILRGAYRGWYFARHIEEVEGIGIERELAGLPKITGPEGMNLFDQSDERMVEAQRAALDILSSVRKNEAEGVLLPHGWEMELMSSGGRRQIDTGPVIERWNRQNLMQMLADFIMIGHESVGSFSLTDAKTNLFAVAIGAFLEIIADVYNRYAVPRLFEFNQKFPQDRHPRIVPGDIDEPDPLELAQAINNLSSAGVLQPDDDLENEIRRRLGLPPKPDAPELEERNANQRAAQEGAASIPAGAALPAGGHLDPAAAVLAGSQSPNGSGE